MIGRASILLPLSGEVPLGRDPHRERPCDRDHLDGMSGEMRLLGVKLAPMARAHELDGVSYSRWPVETLSESVPYEGPRSGVVATSPQV